MFSRAFRRFAKPYCYADVTSIHSLNLFRRISHWICYKPLDMFSQHTSCDECHRKFQQNLLFFLHKMTFFRPKNGPQLSKFSRGASPPEPPISGEKMLWICFPNKQVAMSLIRTSITMDTFHTAENAGSILMSETAYTAGSL